MPPRPVLRRPDGPTVHPVRHPDLDGRAEPDQHPVTAIEGLAEWLADHIAAGANVTVTEADGVLTISASGGSGGGSGAAIIAAPNADLDLAGQITAQRTIVTLPDPTPDWRTFTLPPTSELSVGDEITAVLREQLSYSGQGWLTYVASGDEIIVADGVTDGGGVVQTTPFVLAPMASTRWTFMKVAAGRWALGDPLITTNSQGDQNTVQVTDGNGGFYPAPGILAESGKLTVGTVDTPATMEVNGATPSTDQFLGHDGSALGWSTPTAAMVGAVPASDVGAPGGVAELDGSGLVLVSQLPAFVDDVLEFANLAAFPVTGESGKIYVAIDTLRTYRWSGSTYTEVSASLALGSTSSTAHRGDHGATAYTHSQTSGNPHGTSKADVGLGNVDNTSDANKPVSTAQQTALDGKAAASHSHSAADITSGTVATARLGSGTADGTTFLRGDQTWAAAGSPRPALPRTSGAWYTLGGITNNAATTTPNAAGMLVAHPVWLPAGSYDRVGVATSAAGTATWRLGLYPSNPTAVTPDGLALVASLGTIDMSATPGVLTATITLTVPTAGLYWAAVLVDAHTSAPTVYGWDGNSARAAFLPWDGYLIADGGIRGMWARYVSGIPTGAMPATYPVSISTDVRIPQVRFRAA